MKGNFIFNVGYMFKTLFLSVAIMFVTPLALASGLKDYEHEVAVKVEDIKFYGNHKAVINLSDFLGKVVVLNFWATWCRPCVAEMPVLDELSHKLEGRNLIVVPLSIDYKGVEVVEDFYAQHNIKYLPAYNDARGKSFKAFKLRALPTTIIINKSGKEVARVVGEIDWSTPEVIDYLRKLYSE